MEAVREKKPKAKPRSVNTSAASQAPSASSVLTPTRAAPPIPPRLSIPSTSAAAEPEVCASPEPEEIELPPSFVTQSAIQEEPPPLPTRVILPKISRQAPPLPEKAPLSAGPVAKNYPALPALSDDLLNGFTEISLMASAPPAYADLFAEAQGIASAHLRPAASEISAPPMYPSIDNAFVNRTEHGLLSEAHLISFYHNPLYEQREAFTERFVQSEELPSGPLFELLARLKETAEDAAVAAVAEAHNAEALKKCLQDCWLVQQAALTYQGHCGENVNCTAHGSYQSATLVPAKVDDMRKLLAANRNVLLEKSLANEIQFRSLGLQIQWIVNDINARFLAEYNLSPQAVPLLVEGVGRSAARRLLLAALSDCFFHVRFLQPPKRFSDAVSAWIQELCSALQKRCTSEDAQFLLLHALRTPSPSAEWTAPLIQTFCGSAATNRLKMDHCVAMLSHLMAPIAAREDFLRAVVNAENEESSWAILGPDEDADFSFVSISEADLSAFLDQLPISDFFEIANRNFAAQYAKNSEKFVALIAFQLILMKILREGLDQYGEASYKGFCKQIGMYLRQSVRELCNIWRTQKSVMPASDSEQLQLEVDRVLLLCVQYILSRQNLGLCQFLVDLPYEYASEDCRRRISFLLRSPAKGLTARQVYDIPTRDLPAKCLAMPLAERVNDFDSVDCVFLLKTFATLASVSTDDLTAILSELIDICFCNEKTRDSLYKVGSEALAQIVLRKPATLDSLLVLIDRRIYDMQSVSEPSACKSGSSALFNIRKSSASTNRLASSSSSSSSSSAALQHKFALDTLDATDFSSCRLSQNVLGSVIGKWLINNPPEHPANRLARRVLSSLNWGYLASGELAIDAGVHLTCAETVVKAHLSHCTRSNGLIAKSMQKVAKLASKIADHENHFNEFVWAILIKLKLSPTPSAGDVQTDLAAFFVFINQHSLSDVRLFLDKGVELTNGLLNAGCITACAVILSRLMKLHFPKISTLCLDKKFLELVEKILHSDQSPFAIQLLTGPSATPTPVVRIIQAGITKAANELLNPGDFIRAWTDLLCIRRPTAWSSDPVSLQILGTIVRQAFLKDAANLFVLRPVFSNLYSEQLSVARDASRGLLSFLSGEPPPPPLLQPSLYAVAPWATYLLLQVEAEAFPMFHVALWETLAKKPKLTLDAAISKAASKTKTPLSADQFCSHLWASAIEQCKNHEVLPLLVQQLVISLFKRRQALGHSHIFARRIVSFRHPSIVAAEKTLSGIADPKGFYKATFDWISANADMNAPGFNFSRFNLDYLLQLVIAGDVNVWMDFVSLPAIQAAADDDVELFNAICHEERRSPPPVSWAGPSRKDRIVKALAFPSTPTHPGLPPVPRTDSAVLSTKASVIELFSPIVQNVNKLSGNFASRTDDLEEQDQKYAGLIAGMYSLYTQQVPVVLKCGMRCQMPVNASVQVAASVFSQAVDAEMTQNRERRGALIAMLQTSILDPSAVEAAKMEFISRQIAGFAEQLEGIGRERLQDTGRSIFYMLTSSISSEALLFAPMCASFNHALSQLSRQFIANRPEEQHNVMRLVLDGFVLSEPLVEAYTPQCLTPAELCVHYTSLSEAVSDPEKSLSALKLLARLQIDEAASSLPPQQFATLIRLAFANATSQTDPASPLHQLCLQHFVAFVFHRFPLNFGVGLETAVAGCAAASTPDTLLDVFVVRLDAANFITPKSNFCVSGVQALESCVILARCLREARSLLGANLYNVMGKYLPAITQLALLFLHTAARETFNPDAPESVMLKALNEAFSRIALLFLPLIAPPSASMPPFSSANKEASSAVLRGVVNVINALPYLSCIAPGCQNAQSLVWQLFCEKLSVLTHGAVEYYAEIEHHFMHIDWKAFWPSLRALTAMNEVLSCRAEACFSFVTQVFVRVPWEEVVARHVPDELLPTYMATILFVVTRIIARPQNYAIARASLTRLHKQFAKRAEWQRVAPEECAKVSTTLSQISLPCDSAERHSEVVATFLNLWRIVCQFSVRDASDSKDVLLKQRAFVFAETRLMFGANIQNTVKHYLDLIADCDAIVAALPPGAELSRFAVVSSELTAIWSNISDQEVGETLVTTYTSYLSSKTDSQLVLLTMYGVVKSLPLDQITTSLKVMEKAMHCYFSRANSGSEVFSWAMFPSNYMDSILHFLLTVPNSDNKVQPLLLTLRVVLDHGTQPDEVFEHVFDYLEKLKPKYVTSEATVLTLLRRLLRWLSDQAEQNKITADSASVCCLLRWLARAKNEERPGLIAALISVRKNTYSLKFRLVITILELFAQHQTCGSLLRLHAHAAVTNSKVKALRDLADVKQHLPYSAIFNSVTSFFASTDYTFKDIYGVLDAMLKVSYNERFTLL